MTSPAQARTLYRSKTVAPFDQTGRRYRTPAPAPARRVRLSAEAGLRGAEPPRPRWRRHTRPRDDSDQHRDLPTRSFLALAVFFVDGAPRDSRHRRRADVPAITDAGVQPVQEDSPVRPVIRPLVALLLLACPSYRAENVPDFTGSGGETARGGNAGAAGSSMKDCSPHLRNHETRLNLSMLIKL